MDLFTLTNGKGMTVKVANYGGIVTSLTAPDRNGKFNDVVLGFDTLDKYLAGHPYFGAIVCRYGNRIARGKFSLNGTGAAILFGEFPGRNDEGKKMYPAGAPLVFIKEENSGMKNRKDIIVNITPGY